ncbi:prepilin-type N-terminal cleavage/methylation domain-containing protein [Acidaminobacter sp. JC074]|uniref:prepilin-type N-terminal cleavage/methylation domain-containing protein n=1 Tax=Acidaminobacter sp. JC074 TaxID=2530199 RepID=UPI001F0ED19E|nr:prepilin-type N-terminal cleavage/methylation domain-containing protein [Acidaminobacter sp. JC074]MCH4889722.1 prepilin-type N-terminal cleavage/methylation domain-containing protein [Acidaminobacter sp. JC074]
MKNSKGFTLIEIIISIAIFSIISVVLLQLFIVAENVNLESKSKELALFYGTSFIEEFKASRDLPESSYQEIHHYDEDWQRVDHQSVYILSAEVEVEEVKTGHYYKLKVSAFDENDILILLNTEHYVQEVANE